MDYLSVGALTHSAPALDISLEVETGKLITPDDDTARAIKQMHHHVKGSDAHGERCHGRSIAERLIGH